MITGLHRARDRTRAETRARVYPPPMDEFSVFVFGMLVVIVLIFLAIGKWYPGSGAEQVDWKPTRWPSWRSSSSSTTWIR